MKHRSSTVQSKTKIQCEYERLVVRKRRCVKCMQVISPQENNCVVYDLHEREKKNVKVSE